MITYLACTQCYSAQNVMWRDYAKTYLCAACHGSALTGGKMDAYCDTCHKEYKTKTIGGPFICEECYWLETGMTPDEDKPVTKPHLGDNMSVDRALDIFQKENARDKVDQQIVMARVKSYVVNNLSGEVSFAKQVRDLAEIDGVSVKDMLNRIYKAQIYVEGVDLIMAIHHEIAYKAYEAKLEDFKAKVAGKVTNHLGKFMKENPQTFCFLEDDPDYVPF